MKKILLATAITMSLGIGVVSAQIFNKNYLYKPTYQDLATVKATEQVNDREIITVGFIPENEISSSEEVYTQNDAIIVKTDQDGNVIWSLRYGLPNLDERAHGLDVTYDGKHVIVVGMAETPVITPEPPSTRTRNVLAFKINIATGNVVWSNTYGTTDGTENGFMIEKVFSFPFNDVLENRVPALYTIVGTATNSEAKDPFQRIYAVSIIDNGFQWWGKRYVAGGSGLPILYNTPFTFVRTPERNWMVAGTRWEINRPSNIFTMGINPFDGSITDKFVHYNVNNGYSNGGAITAVNDNLTTGYALAFSTYGGFSSPEPDPLLWQNKITVLRLNKDRKPIWTNFYWQPENNANTGLSIYQARIPAFTALFDIYVGTTTNQTSKPGFARLNNNGSVNYFYKYNKFGLVRSNHNATAMVQSSTGYVQKSLYNRNNQDPDRGFSMAQTDFNGKTWCVDDEKLERREVKTEVESEAYEPVNYGVSQVRPLRVSRVEPIVTNCFFKVAEPAKTAEQMDADSESQAFDLLSDVSVFPNPLEQNQDNFTLRYQSPGQQAVELKVFNTVGQLVLSERVNLNEGPNELNVDATGLSTGLNLVTISIAGQVLHTIKVIKK